MLDSLFQRAVLDFVHTLPSNSKEGDVYILTSEDHKIAIYLNGWRLIEVKNGWIFWVQSKKNHYSFIDNYWTPLVAPFYKMEVASGVFAIRSNIAQNYYLTARNDITFTLNSSSFDVDVIKIILFAQENIKIIWPEGVVWDNKDYSQNSFLNAGIFMMVNLWVISATQVLGRISKFEYNSHNS